MLSRTIKVNEKDYTFINAYRKNRSGFVHECELHIGAQVFDAKCQYYNRTWECYTYQTVMIEALYNYSDYVKSHLKERFLDEKGKLHLSKAGLCAYAHGEYFALGEKQGSFGYSIAKKKVAGKAKKRKGIETA